MLALRHFQSLSFVLAFSACPLQISCSLLYAQENSSDNPDAGVKAAADERYGRHLGVERERQKPLGEDGSETKSEGGAASNVTAGAAGGVVVKGWRNGLLILIPHDGAWDDVLAQMDDRLDEAKARSFWRGAQTTIDCGMRRVTLDEMTALTDRMKRAFGLVPIALVAAEMETRAAGDKLLLTTYAEMPVVHKPFQATVAQPEPAPRPAGAGTGMAPAGAGNALYVPATVRSGQRMVHEGHLVICGDVNAGSEVIASGDILIFGTLRGLAHAGCYGDERARIVALNLRPPQLRIASKIARAPEEAASGGGRAGGATVGKAGPEVARIENGEIQVFPL